MDKVFPSPEAAVADLGDGASIAVAGFGIGHRFPTSLIAAVAASGAKDLCLICNSVGGGSLGRPQLLVENRQVSKLIAAFSARAGVRSPVEDQLAAGEMTVELVPQGTLVERCRAGGAGIPAFYTPTTVGTPLAEGKEVRYFNGQPYVLEHALRPDYAFLRASRADRTGNLQFRGGSQNFNPSFAKAARVAIAEVDEIVEVGDIPPDRVGLPGIFVSRVVKSTVTISLDELTRWRRRPADASRVYNGKPGLTRNDMARRVAQLLPEGSCVNLGTGMPVLVSNYLQGRDVMLHAENGILGCGEIVAKEQVDPDVYDAAGQFVSLKSGASFFDSVTSFEMARGGKLTAVILGAYQVDQQRNLANWSTPEMVGGAIGGAMDLVAGGSTLIVMMEHRDSRDRAKLVRECTYPLTGKECVDVLATDLALFRRRGRNLVLEEIAPGFTVSEIQELTEMEFEVAAELRELGLDT